MRIYAKRKRAKLYNKQVKPSKDGVVIDFKQQVVTTQDIWEHSQVIPNNALLTFPDTVLPERSDLDDWVSSRRDEGCLYCGEAVPVCLVFHHRQPSAKITTVPTMPRSRLPLAMIQAEASKCDVVCCNCHVKLHAGILPLPLSNNSTD